LKIFETFVFVWAISIILNYGFMFAMCQSRVVVETDKKKYRWVHIKGCFLTSLLGPILLVGIISEGLYKYSWRLW